MSDKVDVLGEFHKLALRAAPCTSGKKWPKVPGINFRFSYFPLKIKSNFQAGQKHGLNLLFLHDISKTMMMMIMITLKKRVNDDDDDDDLTEGKQAKKGGRGNGSRKR